MNLDLKNYINNSSPGYVIEVFNNGNFSEIVVGNKCVMPVVEETTCDTLYDIASLTKTYTATLVYMAYEEGVINIYDHVYDIDNRFVNLKKVRVIDLLSHNQEIWTDGYLGSTKSKEDFYKILYSSSVKNNIPKYIDTHYIILSTLLEKVYDMDYKGLVNKKIIQRLNLKNTTFDPDMNRTASNNYEHVGETIVDYITPGVVHDPKARVAKTFGITTGHASIFTTAHDLIIFLKTFLDCTLLKQETIDFMLQHRNTNLDNYNYLKTLSSKSDINDMYEEVLGNNPDVYLPRTYNNMGTRHKNDIKVLNDVPALATDNSVSFNGFTGPMFTIDFDKRIIVVIMCNVMHNTHLNREERKSKVVEIMNLIFEKLSI